MRDGYENLSFQELQVITDHLQLQIPAPEGNLITVDALLAPILSYLWNAGYTTRFSCQGGNGDNHLNADADTEFDSEGYIFFEDPIMGEAFAETVNEHFPYSEYPVYGVDKYGIFRFRHEALSLFHEVVLRETKTL